MKTNKRKKDSAGTQGRRFSPAQAGTPKLTKNGLIKRLQKIALNEVDRVFPDAGELAGSGFLHAKLNPMAAATPVVCNGLSISAFVPLGATKKVLLPLLQMNYQVVGNSPAADVVVLKKADFFSTAELFAAFADLCSRPLPEPVRTTLT